MCGNRSVDWHTQRNCKQRIRTAAPQMGRRAAGVGATNGKPSRIEKMPDRLQSWRFHDSSLLCNDADSPIQSFVLCSSSGRHCIVYGFLLCPLRGLKMKTKRTTRQWLATRTLRDSANSNVEVQLGIPEQLEDGNWRCAFRLTGLNRGKTAYAGGIDALQALVNALDGIATQLRESGRVLTWMGCEPGVRRQIPIFLGPEFANEIEALIEVKIESFIRDKKRGQRKQET